MPLSECPQRVGSTSRVILAVRPLSGAMTSYLNVWDWREADTSPTLGSSNTVARKLIQLPLVTSKLGPTPSPTPLPPLHPRPLYPRRLAIQFQRLNIEWPTHGRVILPRDLSAPGGAVAKGGGGVRYGLLPFDGASVASDGIEREMKALFQGWFTDVLSWHFGCPAS